MNLSELPEHVAKAIVGVRNVTAKELGKLKKGPDGRFLCRWCHGPTKPPRKTWCSDECVSQYTRLTNVREEVEKRDRGICQNCRQDTRELQSIITEIKPLINRLHALKFAIERSEHGKFHEMGGQWADRYNKARQDYKESLYQLLGYHLVHPELFKKRRDQDFPILNTDHAAEYDHITPTCKGGCSTLDNMILLCVPCHRFKSAEETRERARKLKEKK